MSVERNAGLSLSAADRQVPPLPGRSPASLQPRKGQSRRGQSRGAGWTLDDIPWDRFDSSKVDRDLLRVIKAASLVERNGHDYARYLGRIFRTDAAFLADIDAWGREEAQHGMALARWAALADPGYDFQASLSLFSEKIRLPSLPTSVRGSLTGELIARCVVETGTSSYYSAIADTAREPVLQDICRRIAADEIRHFKLFYSHMRRYQQRDRLGLPRRLAVALRRVLETEDDELAYAYFAANAPGQAYDRRRFSQAYARRAYGVYRPHHIARGVAMIFKATGLRPHGWASRQVAWLLCRLLRFHTRRLAMTGA